jgi:acyl-CoA thioesterase I
MRWIIAGLATFTLVACGDGAAPAAHWSDSAAGAAFADGTDTLAVGEAVPGGDTLAAAPNGRRAVVFLGTSLTAGYGVGQELAYPALVQQHIDAAELPFRVVNAGISGETSAGGLRRIDWWLQQPLDVLVLELGANDGLRGLDPEQMRRNLDQILSRTRARYPDADLVLLGMEAPPNLGDAYTDQFRSAFREVALVHGATLLPFFLDGVAGDPALNLDDGIHPNEAGHRVIARAVWRTLEPVLRRAAERRSSDSP